MLEMKTTREQEAGRLSQKQVRREERQQEVGVVSKWWQKPNKETKQETEAGQVSGCLRVGKQKEEDMTEQVG